MPQKASRRTLIPSKKGKKLNPLCAMRIMEPRVSQATIPRATRARGSLKGEFAMSKKVRMHRSFVFAGVLLSAAGVAVAQDFPKIETAPGFSYVHNSEVFGGSKSFNCAGG